MKLRQGTQPKFSRRTKIYSFVVVLVLVLATLQALGGAGFLFWTAAWLPQPVVMPLKKVSGTVQQVLSGVGKLWSLHVENGELKSRIKELEVKVAALSAVEAENQVLKKTLEFEERSNYDLVACTVIAQDPEGLTFTLLLSCGSEDGVQDGQAVVVEGYLVGKVILTGKNESTARLLVSPSLSVDAKVIGRQVSGVVKGSFGAGMALDLIPSTSGVTAGDLVATAGINQQIPPDLLIGTVSEVLRIPGGIFDQISLSSPVDLKDIRFVHVTKKKL